MIIRPAKCLRGRFAVPGDKSISHRAALIAAIAQGTSRVANFASSADCAATISCLRQLGIDIEQSGNQLLVHGKGTQGLVTANAPLDCANSGTTMRLLAGILAGQSFNSTMDGDASLRSRPMRRIIDPLRIMGASIASSNGRAPLTIEGQSPLQPISYDLPVASAQVKSCILLAGLLAEGETKVTEMATTPTRDHTERMLSWFGVTVDASDNHNNRTLSVRGPAHLSARDVLVPGDLSSAAYFVAAAGLLPESMIEVMDVGVNPTRSAFIAQLQSFGLDVKVINVREQCNETVGSIIASGSNRAEQPNAGVVRIDGPVIAQLIDELPLLAVIGSQIKGGIEIRDASELRAKESDRIATTVENLRAMGATVEEFDDGLYVSGSTQLRGATIQPHGDHRIAMAFAIAALLAEGETEIAESECVAVSFPEFFNLLESVTER